MRASLGKLKPSRTIHDPPARQARRRRTAADAARHPHPRSAQDVRPAHRDRRRLGRHRPRRVLYDRRSERMRQDHAAAHPCRPRIRHLRRHRDRNATFAAAGEFDDLPGRLDLPLDDGLGQRRLRPQDAARAIRHRQGGGRPLSRAHGSHPFREILSAPAFRRHAPARVDRARLCQRSRNSADGRAVLGARRAEQAAVAGRAAAHLGGAQEDRGVHHPFGRRGGVSRGSHHGHDGAAGEGEDVRASAADTAAQHHGVAEDAAIRRADCAHLVEPARGSAPCAPAGGGDQIMSVQTISTGSQAAPKMSARTRDRLLNIISPLALLVLWELCARFGFIDTRFFPAPSSVVSTMIEMLRTGELVTHTAVSMQRLFYGAILGGVPALVLGIAMGLNRPIRALFDPLIAATYPVPKSAILPLALLIFGLGEASKIFMVAVGVFFPVVINATTGVLEINKIYLDVGRNYKANRWNTFWTIALPGALPVIMTGFKLGIGIGLVLIAVAEMVGAKSGLGYLIWSAWSTFAVEQMYVGLFVIAIIGFLITLALNELERVIIPWKADN